MQQFWKLWGASRRTHLPRSVILSVALDAGGDKRYCNFVDMHIGLSTGRQQRRVQLDNTQGLVRRAGFSTSDSTLDVLRVAERGLPDSLMQVDLCCVVSS